MAYNDRLEIAKMRGNVRKEWKEATDQLVAAYENGTEWVEYVRDHIYNLYHQSENKQSVASFISTINITERIVDELSAVYENKPTRKLTDEAGNDLPDAQQEEYRNIIEAVGWDDTMSEAERMASLLNNVVIHLAPDFISETFVPEIVTCPDVLILQNEMIPSNFAQARTLAIPAVTTAENYNGEHNSGWLVYYFDSDNPTNGVQVVTTNYSLNATAEQPEDLQRYLDMTGYPLFLVRPNTPARRSEVYLDAPADLLGISKWVAWRDAARSFVESIKEMEPYKMDGDKDTFVQNNGAQAMNSAISMIFSGGGVIDNIVWNPQVDAYQAEIRDRLNRFAQARKLSKAFAESIVAESGKSLYWQELPKRKHRDRRIGYYTKFEKENHRQLMEMAAICGMQVSDAVLNSNLDIMFPPLRSEMSPSEQLEYHMMRVSLGIEDAADAMAAIDGIDIAAAQDRVNKIAVNRKSNGRAALNAIANSPAQTATNPALSQPGEPVDEDPVL